MLYERRPSMPKLLNYVSCWASGGMHTRPPDVRISSKHLHVHCTAILQVPIASFTRKAPNPSIERTSPGKPGAASHVKRWASR
jgi:hypothetical protein